jgi:hypothetical protein
MVSPNPPNGVPESAEDRVRSRMLKNQKGDVAMQRRRTSKGLTVTPLMRRAEKAISARVKRSAAKLLTHQRYGLSLPADRTLLTEMIRAAFRLAIAFEHAGFGRRKISVEHLSNLIQDLFLHFDDLDLKGTSPWNVLEDLLDEVRVNQTKVVGRKMSNPFRSFHANIALFERARRQTDAVVFLLTAWADLASCLAACLRAEVDGSRDKLRFVRVLP